MSNEYFEHLNTYFAEKTGLSTDQFGFFQKGGDGYTTVIVAQNDKLVELGELSYNAFIRNEFNSAARARGAINKFLDLCAEKLQDPTVEVPNLPGNFDYWDERYKKSLQDHISTPSH